MKRPVVRLGQANVRLQPCLLAFGTCRQHGALRVEELQGAAIVLASDASSFVNGQTIFVDGGVIATLRRCLRYVLNPPLLRQGLSSRWRER